MTATKEATVQKILTSPLLDENVPWIREKVPLKDLKVDNRYQRKLQPTFVKKILDEGFDERAAHLIVSLRDNTDLYIVNGQHCAKAAEEAGYTELTAQIVDCRDWHEEARLRRLTNTSKKDNSREQFKTKLAEGVPQTVDIDRILRSCGTYINSPDVIPASIIAGRRRGAPADGLDCVSAVEEIYTKSGAEGLTATCRFIVQIFDDFSGRKGSASMIKAISWLLEKHKRDDHFDHQRMALRLRTVGEEEIHNKANKHKAIVGGSMWKNYYRAMLEVYNESVRGEAKRMRPVEY